MGTEQTAMNVQNTSLHHRWQICQFGELLSLSTQIWMFRIMYNLIVCLGIKNQLHSSGNQLLIKLTTQSLYRAEMCMFVSGMWRYTNRNLC